MFKKAKASGYEMLGVKALVDRYVGSLQSLRKWWFVLIPFLIWRGRKAYDNEIKVIAEEAQKTAVKQLKKAREETQQRQKDLDQVAIVVRDMQTKLAQKKQGRK